MVRNESYMETILAAKGDFYNEIVPSTRKALKDWISETDPEHARTCRIEYLKEQMTDEIVYCWMWMAWYEKDVQRDLPAINRLYCAWQIKDTVKKIQKLQGEIIAMKKPERPGQITDDMIERAREYPMLDILEGFGCHVRLNRCACPVHGGKNPSSFSVKDNRGICHCGWHGDSIELYRELHKVDFVTAVKELQ